MLLISDGSLLIGLYGLGPVTPLQGQKHRGGKYQKGRTEVARPMRRIVISSLRSRGLAGQPELDAQGGGKIRRLAVALGWLETNLSGRLFRRLVEPVSQGFDHADDAYRAAGLEDHGKRHLALNAQSACLLRVGRVRLGEYLDRLESAGAGW